MISAVTVTGDSNYTAADLQKNYEIINVDSGGDWFEVTASSNETGAGMTAAGAATVTPYITVGPTTQTIGYGWGTYLWGDSTWGTERTTSTVTLDPGNWHLDNYGEVLVATIFNGKTFTWNAGAANPRTVRASTTTTDYQTTNNPTASIMTIVSDRDRHLFHLGTETTIGDSTTQDPMFIRFSNQEDLNTYAPTATNTAGTFRVDNGNEIRAGVTGKDYLLILTDTAAYVAQYVGPPFTFSIKLVGTNCGCIGQHAAVAADGAAPMPIGACASGAETCASSHPARKNRAATAGTRPVAVIFDLLLRIILSSTAKICRDGSGHAPVRLRGTPGRE